LPYVAPQQRGVLYPVVVGLSLYRVKWAQSSTTRVQNNSKSILLADEGLSRRRWAVHNVCKPSLDAPGIEQLMPGVEMLA